MYHFLVKIALKLQEHNMFWLSGKIAKVLKS